MRDTFMIVAQAALVRTLERLSRVTEVRTQGQDVTLVTLDAGQVYEIKIRRIR